MPAGRIGIPGLELHWSSDERALSLTLTAQGRAWRWLYCRLIRPPARWLAGLLGRLAGAPRQDAAPRGEVPNAASLTRAQRDLLERVSRIRWYHTIDLGDGIVTPGAFDLRPYLHHYPLPERMDGMRVLDVGSFDGFWAFEFERRGAAEVVSLDVDSFADLDFPPRARACMTEEDLGQKLGEGFRLAHDVLGSGVKREVMNAYDLSPAAVGKFDLVFIGDLLLHTKTPIRILENVYSVTSGAAVIADCYNPALDRYRPYTVMEYRGGREDVNWWVFSLHGLEQMIRDAGFDRVERVSTHRFGRTNEEPRMWHVIFRAAP